MARRKRKGPSAAAKASPPAAARSKSVSDTVGVKAQPQLPGKGSKRRKGRKDRQRPAQTESQHQDLQQQEDVEEGEADEDEEEEQEQPHSTQQHQQDEKKAGTITPHFLLRRHLDPSSHTLHAMTVISASKINKKVTRILTLLGLGSDEGQVNEPGKDGKEEGRQSGKETGANNTGSMADPRTGMDKAPAGNIAVVSLSAKAPTASKAISVAEIVKRTAREMAISEVHTSAGPAAAKEQERAAVKAADSEQGKPTEQGQGGKKRKRDESEMEADSGKKARLGDTTPSAVAAAPIPPATAAKKVQVPILYQYNLLHEIAPPPSLPGPTAPTDTKKAAVIDSSKAITDTATTDKSSDEATPASSDSNKSPNEQPEDGQGTSNDQAKVSNADTDMILKDPDSEQNKEEGEQHEEDDEDAYFETAITPSTLRTVKSRQQATQCLDAESDPQNPTDDMAQSDIVSRRDQQQHQRHQHPIPVLTIVFSRARIESLRRAFGEQVVSSISTSRATVQPA